MAKLPVPRVEIHQYFGKFGSFDFAGRLMWRCHLIGVNGKKMFGGNWQAEGSGHPDKQYSLRDARKWAEFTGWPLVDRGRVIAYDEMPPNN